MNLESTSILRTESFEIDNPDVFVETVSGDVRIVESPDGKWRQLQYPSMAGKFPSSRLKGVQG